MPDIDIGGYEVDQDSNGDLVIRDTNDNIVFRWDDTKGTWTFDNNPIEGVTDFTAESVNTDGVRNRNLINTRKDARYQYFSRGEPVLMTAQAANFEDLTNWDISGNATTTSTESFTGSTSVTGVDDTSSFSVDWFDGSSIDLTGWIPSFAIKIDTSVNTDFETVAVKVADGAGNFFQFRRTINPDKHASDWHVIDLGPSDDPAESAFDPTNVQTIRISAGGKCFIDNLLWVKQPDTGGIVSFIFDDGDNSVHSNAFPEFQKRGMVASAAVISGIVGDSGSLSESQIDELYRAGWSIPNHGTVNEPLQNKTESEARQVVSESKDFIQRNGWLNGEDSYIYMGGGYDSLAMDVVNDYHELAFTTGTLSTGMASVRNRNPMAITRPFLSGETLSAMKTQVDIAAAWDAFAPLSFHTVGSTGDITTSDLGDLLDYCDTKGVEVVSLDRYAEYQRSEV